MNKWKALLSKVLLGGTLLLPFGSPAYAENGPTLSAENIDALVEARMDEGKIPGMEVVVVQGNQITYSKGYGYANLESNQPVTDATLFEIGSTSKAFTALALLKLEQDGRLRMSDPVTHYLPWLELTYQGQKQVVTLEQFLHHTSGIPFRSIGGIPTGSQEDALERTVRTLTDTELEHAPGSTYTYATINYDVLGLVIQKASGQPFESYVQEQVIQPLGFKHTLVGRKQSYAEPLAQGYKIGFTGARPYDAPDYRGNTPAGYVITNGQDMAHWLKVQLGTATGSTFDPQLIARSHQPNRTVEPFVSGSSYAAGWEVYQNGGGEISHGGSNPNFSSFFAFRPQEQIAVGVLANLDSVFAQTVAQDIMNTMLDKPIPKNVTDPYRSIDKIATVAVSVFIPAILVVLGFTGQAILEAFRGRRRFVGLNSKRAVDLLKALCLMGLFVLSLYWLPNVLFSRLPWSFIAVWGPTTIPWAIGTLFALGCAYFLHHLVSLLTEKSDDKPFLNLITLSLVSGMGNAFIIFVISQTFGKADNLTNGLLFYFFIGILMYVYGQRVVRGKLVTMTSDIVYRTRTELIDKILKAPFQKVEELQAGKIQSSLNNDTEVISGSINAAINGLTNLITLLCCFLYLGMMNGFGLLISVVVIVCTAGLYFVIGNKAGKAWEKTRDIQNAFFGFIQDLTGGFKELYLNGNKRRDFRDSMVESCDAYRVKRVEGELRFANVFVIGELLFTVVIGFVAFVFPLLFPDIQDATVRNYIFVLLYITGPVNGILRSYPEILRMKISWNRVKQLSKDLSELEASTATSASPLGQPEIELEVRGVTYQYKGKDGTMFGVGPIHLNCRSGEIVFITGGNGSGKSTLAKLITGLYAPHEGEVCINGEAYAAEQLGSFYSAIFADFYLFDRLYGIDVSGREQEIERYVDILQLSDKVQVLDGAFTTTKLSTGQKKRLALLISYLEDLPICLFDEWAADQDPEYRKFFYHSLLPEMRAKGKLVLAITHDDSYFHLADRLIKLEMGQIVQQETLAAYQGV